MNKKFLTAITVVIILVLSISFAIVAFNLPENKKGENSNGIYMLPKMFNLPKG